MYTDKRYNIVQQGTLNEKNLAATTGSMGYQFFFGDPMKITQIGILVTTDTNFDSVPAQIDFFKRPSVTATGPNGTETLIGTVIVGDVDRGGYVYKDIPPVHMDPGDVLYMDLRVLGLNSASGASGGGVSMFNSEYDPEVVKNQKSSIKSA